MKKYSITGQDIAAFEDRMKPERVQVMILFAQGYTYEQMAAYLQIPVGTVKSRLFRGRADLNKLEGVSLVNTSHPEGMIIVDDPHYELNEAAIETVEFDPSTIKNEGFKIGA